MTGRRCAYCETDIAPGQEREVDLDHGTSASSTLLIHDLPDDCAPVTPVRRHNGYA